MAVGKYRDPNTGEFVTLPISSAAAKYRDPATGEFRSVIAAPTAAGTAHTIQDEGNSLTERGALNFTGGGVTASDDAANSRTNVVVPASEPAGAITTHKTASGAHPITSITDLETTLEGKFGLTDKSEPGAEITDPTNQRIFQVDIHDDGTPTANWPDRFQFRFEDVDVGGAFVRSGGFNEYGEIRADQAKRNTVALRAHGHSSYNNSVADGVAAVFQVRDRRGGSLDMFSVYRSRIVSLVPMEGIAPTIASHLATKSYVDATVASGGADPVYLRRTPVSATGDFDGQPPANVIDGSTTTYWQGTVDVGSQITLDFGSSAAISHIRWYHGATNRPSLVYIESSADNVVFSGRHTVTETPEEGWTEVDFTEATEQYWRFSSPDNGWQLYEVELYGVQPFGAAGPWTGLNFQNSTVTSTSLPNMAPAAWRKDGNTIQLRGGVYSAGGLTTSASFAILPGAARPAYNYYAQLRVGSAARQLAVASGTGTLSCTSTIGVGETVYLDGVVIPLG